MAYKDRERQLQYAREWLKRYPEKARAAAKRWKQRHPEAVRAMKRAKYAREPEKYKAAMDAYHRRNPEVRRTAYQRYRSRKLAAAGSYTTAEWVALLDAHGHLCAYCGTSGALQAEHRIPLSRGGTNNIENIVPACARCNARKHRLTDEEFRARLEAEKRDPRLREAVDEAWVLEPRLLTID